MLILQLVCPSARAADPGSESKTQLILHPDGSCLIRFEQAMSRFSAQQYAVRMDSEEDPSDAAPATPPDAKAGDAEEPADPPPMTDAALADKLRKFTASLWSWMSEESRPQVERIEVGKDRVVTSVTNHFPTIEAMLEDGQKLVSLSGLGFGRARFEKDGDGHLKITLSRSPLRQPTAKVRSQTWKEARYKGEFRIVLPGRILTSDLPASDGNATWVEADFAREETLQAASLYLSSTQRVVIAEWGGLKLDAPAESAAPPQMWEKPDEHATPSPTQDAGPGFNVEVQSLTLITTHQFRTAARAPADRPSNQRTARRCFVPSTIRAGRLRLDDTDP
jgi:hypothetical protein